MDSISELLNQAATEMETLAHFADQNAWDDLIFRLRASANDIKKGVTK